MTDSLQPPERCIVGDRSLQPGASGGEKQLRTVLIVGQDGEEITLLQETLQPEIDTISASNGLEALRLSWSKPPPDLLLLDVDLDSMDGYEVCATLKDDIRSKDIPILLMATPEQLGDADRGLAMGAADYLVKPLVPSLVRARLATHLELLHQQQLLSLVFKVDEVTGLPSRDHFEEMLDREWRRGRREGKALSLILMAIDFSQAINELCEPDERDSCYRMVAQVLQNGLRRASDFLARYNDEHFAAVLASSDARNATTTAELLREEVADARIEISYDNIVDRITMSFGTASIVPRGDSSPNVLKRAAGKMLTEALDRGRNRVESIDFDPPSLPWFA